MARLLVAAGTTPGSWACPPMSVSAALTPWLGRAPWWIRPGTRGMRLPTTMVAAEPTCDPRYPPGWCGWLFFAVCLLGGRSGCSGARPAPSAGLASASLTVAAGPGPWPWSRPRPGVRARVAGASSGGGGGPAAGPRAVQDHRGGGRDQPGGDRDVGRSASRACRPPLTTWTAGGRGTGPYGPSPGTGMIAAEAAGTAAAQASRAPATAARAAVIRRSRAAVGGWVPRREYVNTFGSRALSILAGRPPFCQVLPARPGTAAAGSPLSADGATTPPRQGWASRARPKLP